MSEFVTPPRRTSNPNKQTISPSKKLSAAVESDRKEESVSTHTSPRKLLKMNKPSKSNPFARPKPESEAVDSSIETSKKTPLRHVMSEYVEKATDELRNIIENSRYSDYDIDSDPHYKRFHKWANDTKSHVNMESGLTVKKTNGTLPTDDELKYLSDIQPYLVAYKIHCKDFSTTSEQFKKCYPIYLKIKQLINEYRDNGIRFFRGDRPNEELIHMVHFPRKKTKKAHSLEKSQKSRSIRKRETHSRGGKKRRTSKISH
jgi:hypothetical protein